MPDMPPLPPPGWYGDPAGTHGSRWWDGTDWTDHVREVPPDDAPPPPPPHAEVATLPLAMSGRNRGVALVAAAALAVGLVATAVVGLRATAPGAAPRAGQAPLGEVLPGVEVPEPVDPGEVADRTAAAGCTTVAAGEPAKDRTHLDPADAPPPAALYDHRPAHSGRHYGSLLPLPDGVAAMPIDERGVLHNMEHGSVVVWFDDDLVDAAGRRTLSAWQDDRADLGFTSRAGGAVFVSPMPVDLEDPPAVALRAWGVAVDCQRFDPVVADAFLVEHWGSHGAAPEGNLAPYPQDSVRLRERT